MWLSPFKSKTPNVTRFNRRRIRFCFKVRKTKFIGHEIISISDENAYIFLAITLRTQNVFLLTFYYTYTSLYISSCFKTLLLFGQAGCFIVFTLKHFCFSAINCTSAILKCAQKSNLKRDKARTFYFWTDPLCRCASNDKLEWLCH